MSDLPEFVLDREFNAPRELVWRAWTDPALLQRWYGPGVETVIHEFDLEPGGVWLNEMKMSGGSKSGRSSSKKSSNRRNWFGITVQLTRTGTSRPIR